MMPSGYDFPMPFGGIHQMVEFSSPEEFTSALAWLTNCHDHNLAVEQGQGAYHKRIWGSELAMKCLLDWDAARKVESVDPYEGMQSFFFNVLKNWFEEHTATRRRDMPHNISVDLRRAMQRRRIRFTTDD